MNYMKYRHSYKPLQATPDLYNKNIHKIIEKIIDSRYPTNVRFDHALRNFAEARWGDQSIPVVSGEVFDSLPGEILLREVTDIKYLDDNIDEQMRVIKRSHRCNGQRYVKADECSIATALAF